MQDYSKCLFDPTNKDSTRKLEQYPEFQFKLKDKDKFISYLILVYDKNSPLFIRNADNLYMRKKDAALQAGFTLDEENHFEKYVEEVLLGENEDMNLAVLRYVRLSGIPDLPVLVKYIEMLDKEMSIKLPDKAKERADVRSNIDTLLTKIEQLETKIFTGKETEAARETLYRLIERIRVPRPENVASDIASKTLDLPDIYEFQIK